MITDKVKLRIPSIMLLGVLVFLLAVPVVASAAMCPTDKELEVVALINQERRNMGLPDLVLDVRLVEAARLHSQDMTMNDFFGHTGSDGSTFWDRILRTGYTPFTGAENVAAGYPAPADTVTGWMNSPGHRAIILESSMREIGAGYAYGSSSSYGHYWTAVFGASQDGALTGPCGLLDVTPEHWAHDFIYAIYNAGITSGCGGGNFCPDDPVTRATMAVFLLTTLGEQPASTCAGTFSDVNAGAVGETFCKFIEKFATLGITAGCGNGKFCPNEPVTRAQMAVFLTTALNEGPAASCNGTFNDVNAGTVGETFCKFIEKFTTLGITAGCGNGKFCPNEPVTRAQMAVFLTVGFLQ